MPGFLQRLGDSRRLRQVMNITDTFTDTITDTVGDGRGGAGEVWRAAGGSRTHLGAQGTADVGRDRRSGDLATGGALWAHRQPHRTWARSSTAPRRCSSSSSSSLSAVSVQSQSQLQLQQL